MAAGDEAPHEIPPDEVLDAIALVQAIRDNDMAGVRAVMMHADWHHMSLALAKMLAVHVANEDVAPDWWRTWAFWAVDRP